MDRLVVDTTVLRRIANDITLISVELTDATFTTSEVAGAVGDSQLAHRLETFMSTWSVARARLLRALEGLDDAARSIAQKFEDADADLARIGDAPREVVNGVPTR